MCFGGSSGPSAEEIYQKKKIDFGPLPSLAMSKNKERTGPELKDVPKKRTGMQKRSLLYPTGNQL